MRCFTQLGLVAIAALLAGTAARADDPVMVEGRILDLEGRPVAGATVRIQHLQSAPDGNLDAWIDAVKRLAKEPYGLRNVGLPGQVRSLTATAGRDGRFAFDALPGDAIATASISGPGIETSEVYILTRDVPTIRVKDPESRARPTVVYYGARFDHAAAPSRPIVGTVRDKDTGTPIAGVHITGMPNIANSSITTRDVEATSDAQGRYQLNGLPTSRGFKLFTKAPAGQPYVNCVFISSAGEPAPGPFPFDMTLKRGVLVRGRLTDKATGQPVPGMVEYFVFQDNPYLGDFPNSQRQSHVTRVDVKGPDGRFAIPALPGRGLIAARATDERFLHGIGSGAIKGLIKDLGSFATYPYFCPTSDKHIFAEINPVPGTTELALELQVDPGRTVTGTIVDPDGQAILAGIEIRTLDVFQSPDSPRGTSTFRVTGLPAGRYRLDFIHQGRKLAGALSLKGDETGSLAVKLQPWGTVAGRVIDEEGKPLTDVEIFSEVREQADPVRGDLRDKPTVDNAGRFRIEGLVPGVKYDAVGRSPNRAFGTVLNGVQVAPGEVKDLGDVKLSAWKKDGD